MALSAPDLRPTLSLNESIQDNPVHLQPTRTKSHEPSIHDVAAVDGAALSHTSTTSVDVEKKWSAWLCVLSSFLFLMPSYGKPRPKLHPRTPY